MRIKKDIKNDGIGEALITSSHHSYIIWCNEFNLNITILLLLVDFAMALSAAVFEAPTSIFIDDISSTHASNHQPRLHLSSRWECVAALARMDAYDILDVIGVGSFGKIRKLQRKSDARVWCLPIEAEMAGESSSIMTGIRNFLVDSVTVDVVI